MSRRDNVAAEDQARIRRARCLVASWDAGEFVLDHYLTGRQTAISPVVAGLLHHLDEHLPMPAVVQRFQAIPYAHDLVTRLIVQDVLVVQDSPLDRQERLLDETWAWSTCARYFHYAARQVRYEEDLAQEHVNLAALARATPPPSAFKDYGDGGFRLPGTFEERGGEFWDILRSRRTRRSFAPRPISLDDFSTVLRWTWGQTRTLVDPDLGPYILRTSPSGGARHPIEVYPVVLRVEGIAPGIYHYSVRRDEIEPLRLGMFDELMVRLCAGQHWVQDAAAVFFMTAVVGRSMWKYRQAMAYRVLQLDAGHLGQTFHLVCTALGLAPFTTAATDDAAIEQELGLDGVTEIAVYTAATGLPAPPDGG